MKKEDILKKARSENNDEREKQVETNAFRAGWLGVSIILLILIGFRSYFNESGSDLVIVLLAQTAASLFYQYKKLGDKKYLIWSILSIGGILLGFSSLLTQYGVF